MKNEFKNDLVKNLDTTITSKKIKVSLFNPIGMGYDGCGTHTHGYGSTAKTNNSKVTSKSTKISL